MPGLLTHDLRVHGTAVDHRTVAFRRAHVHLGQEAQRFVRFGVEVAAMRSRSATMLGSFQRPELLAKRWFGLLVANPD